jgi:hypothetical protein
MNDQHGLPDPSSPSHSSVVSGESPICSYIQYNIDNSAAILIWRGGVRTKKTVSVEDKLRKALQVPLAIGMPTSKDGTKIAEIKKSSTPKGNVEPSITRARTKDDSEDGDGKSGVERDSLDLVDERPVERRSTIAFGSSGEKEVEVRERGASIAAPERGLASASGQGVSSPIKEATELQERDVR